MLYIKDTKDFLNTQLGTSVLIHQMILLEGKDPLTMFRFMGGWTGMGYVGERSRNQWLKGETVMVVEGVGNGDLGIMVGNHNQG